MTAFDACGPLPQNEIVVLEASAGTGKTWTIAALATRYLADGLALLPEMLVMTFNNSAAHDLRTTIRARLVDADRALAEIAAGGGTTSPHPIDQLFAAEPERAPERRRRIRAALGDFDAAVISTIHGFCDRMADELGVLGDAVARTHFVDNLDAVADDVAADLYLRKFMDAPEGTFPAAQARGIARAVAGDEAEIVPDIDCDEVRFARAARTEIRRRQRQLGLHTHEDKIRRLAEALTPKSNPGAAAAADRLRSRHRLVLVDEFQDTDPAQWSILRHAFGRDTTLILIGDPKQSIYGFRGGDIDTYVQATGTADRMLALDTNHRSDAPLVSALGHLLAGARLGRDEIVVHEVGARIRESRLRITDPELDHPLRIRSMPVPGRKWDLARSIRDDVVTDIGRMLAATSIEDAEQGWRPLEPGDIAVLVNSNAAADAYAAALSQAGLPAIHAGATNVFTTEAADAWVQLLEACERPTRQSIRQVALTCFIGMTFAELATADETTTNEVAARVREWARLAGRSIADLMESLEDHGVTERLLGQVGGDRLVTDLRHLGQALHAEQRRNRRGPSGLITWLAEQRRSGSESSRRLETDARAVQVSTVHRAKGLQYPVVYAPDLWWTHQPWRDDDAPFEPIRYRAEDGLKIHVSTTFSGRAATAERAATTNESLRRAYVAMTRAQSHLVLHWAAIESSRGGVQRSSAALPRLLQRGPHATPFEVLPEPPSQQTVTDHPGIACADVGHVEFNGAQIVADAPPELSTRVWSRTLDTQWRRSSYSSLTRAAHAVVPAATDLSEPAVAHLDALLDDPPEVEDAGGASSVPARPAATAMTSAPILDPDADAVSPLADLPRGPAFGTLVHAVLEDFDPEASDLTAELEQHCAHWAVRLPSLGLAPATLAEALRPVVETPLGPIADGRRLRDIGVQDRLPELDFEMPLAGGNRASAAHPGVRLGEVADLLDQHLSPEDPLADYPERLRDPLLAAEELRGFLTGSIDAVLRIGAESAPRFLVVDYKTNWLLPATDPGPLRLGHHTMPVMARAMMDSHYPLQALLYSVALHRFLDWRLTGYAPEQHLGGVAYLFVRGMGGADTPVVDGHTCGVFDWRPPADLITELSTRMEAR